MYVDIHTHNQDDSEYVIKIVNINPIDVKSRDVQRGVSTFFSVGVHPWDAAAGAKVTMLETEAATYSSVIALGETGIDRIHPNIKWQTEVFLQMINLSEQSHKPLIIHAVKAYSDIIGIRRLTKAKMPWIIHSFQGSKESASQLLRHDISLSLGDILFNDKKKEKAIELLQTIRGDRLFLETDDSGRDIIDVYKRVALLSGSGIDRLEGQIFNNFKEIFYNE
ncbi:MAG: TatD family hydrolase [Candidatus Limimorpha sp.]